MSKKSDYKKSKDLKMKNEEKVIKEVKKGNNHKEEKVLSGLKKVDDNRKAIYAFIGGALLVAIIAVIIWPDRIATLKDGTQPVVEIKGKTFTADFLYEKMKDKFSISYLLDYIDDEILSKKYEEDDDMNDSVSKTAEDYISYYSQMGYDEETFLSQNGFESKQDFLDYLKIDYRRKKYYEDYLKSKITDDDINKYYEEKVYGDINTQHLLVKVDDDMTDENAKKKAQEIIDKLNDGKTWDEVKEEYKDVTTFEDLKYVAFNANYESTFKDALVALSENSYTKEPVKTSYGYHVIYRFDQKNKAELKDVKDTIIKSLSDEMDKADSKLYNKTLINMRKEAKIDFKDTVMEKKYNKYCENLLKDTSTNS